MANFNFNCVILGGRLTADPEKRTTQSGDTIASAKLAVNRRSKSSGNEADFFRLIAFKSTADFLCQFFRKGSSICVRGRIQNNNYTDKDGIKHFSEDIIVDDIQFVDSKSDSQFTAPASAPTEGVPQATVGSYSPIPDDVNINMEPVDEVLPF